MRRTFQNTSKLEDSILGIYPSKYFPDEKMYFHASPKFIYETGGLLSKGLIDAFGGTVDLEKDCIVDSRITLCQKGQYPSIPGWHCDFVPRPKGQPDLSLVSDKVRHYMIVLADKEGHSCTEFLMNAFECEIDENNVWQSLDDECKALQPRGFQIKEGELLSFSQLDVHRAVPATCGGWRIFMRLTTGLALEPVNEIRTQVQVYVPMNKAGW